ncbi:hypothetical protein TorRG33x02_273100, partial [Trema orientale]
TLSSELPYSTFSFSLIPTTFSLNLTIFASSLSVARHETPLSTFGITSDERFDQCCWS